MTDNPYLDIEEYKQNMGEMTDIQRAKLEDGDWSSFNTGDRFPKSELNIHDSMPDEVTFEKVVRYWDFASTEPTPQNPEPDYLAGIKAAVDEQGELWFLDGVHVRKSSAGVERTIKSTAELDGESVDIKIEQEGGSQAKFALDRFQTQILPLYTVKTDNVSKSKEDRADPLAAKWQNGKCHAVRGQWLSDFVEEMHNQPDHPFDDQMDAASGAQRYLYEDRNKSGWGC